MKDVNQKVNTAKSVSFENQDGQKVSLYAGAANFGLPLNLGLKVLILFKTINYLNVNTFIFCLGISWYCCCKSYQRL